MVLLKLVSIIVFSLSSYKWEVFFLSPYSFYLKHYWYLIKVWTIYPLKHQNILFETWEITIETDKFQGSKVIIIIFETSFGEKKYIWILPHILNIYEHQLTNLGTLIHQINYLILPPILNIRHFDFFLCGS